MYSAGSRCCPVRSRHRSYARPPRSRHTAACVQYFRLCSDSHPGRREVRDLVAMDTRASQAVDRRLVQVRSHHHPWARLRAVPGSALVQHLQPQPAVFIDFEDVDRNMRRLKAFDPVERLAQVAAVWRGRPAIRSMFRSSDPGRSAMSHNPDSTISAVWRRPVLASSSAWNDCTPRLTRSMPRSLPGFRFFGGERAQGPPQGRFRPGTSRESRPARASAPAGPCCWACRRRGKAFRASMPTGAPSIFPAQQPRSIWSSASPENTPDAKLQNEHFCAQNGNEM